MREAPQGTYGAYTVYAVGDTQWNSQDRLCIGDLNGDGKPDVACTTASSWAGYHLLYNIGP